MPPPPDGEEQPLPGAKANGVDPEFAPEPWVYRDPTTINPREWLLGNMVLRGYATLLGSMGGVGKTAYGIALALTFITGRMNILNLHAFQTGNVWLITLEDDREELERRLTAAMKLHGVFADEIEGRLFINDTASSRPLILAKSDVSGHFIACEDAERIKAGIKLRKIGITIIDPLVKAHALIENDNSHMDGLVGLGNSIARDTRSALVFPCHFRKGGGENGARDAFRGGGSLIDGARLARTLTPMAQSDAEPYGIKPEDAFRYVCVQDAKANLAPKDTASWFQLISIELGNTQVNPLYPAGDNVQAAKYWSPLAGAAQGIEPDTLRAIFAKLRDEVPDATDKDGKPQPGWFYSIEDRAKFPAALALVEVTGKSLKEAKVIVKRWQDDKLLTSVPYTTPTKNKSTKVALDEAQVAVLLNPQKPPGSGE